MKGDIKQTRNLETELLERMELPTKGRIPVKIDLFKKNIKPHVSMDAHSLSHSHSEPIVFETPR